MLRVSDARLCGASGESVPGMRTLNADLKRFLPPTLMGHTVSVKVDMVPHGSSTLSFCVAEKAESCETSRTGRVCDGNVAMPGPRDRRRRGEKQEKDVGQHARRRHPNYVAGHLDTVAVLSTFVQNPSAGNEEVETKVLARGGALSQAPYRRIA